MAVVHTHHLARRLTDILPLPPPESQGFMQQLEWYEGMGCELRGTRSTAAHSAYRQWKRRTSMPLLPPTLHLLLTFNHNTLPSSEKEGCLLA